MFHNPKYRVDAVMGPEVDMERFLTGVEKATGRNTGLDVYVHDVVPADVPDLVTSLIDKGRPQAFVGSSTTLDGILNTTQKVRPRGVMTIAMPHRDKETYSVSPFLALSQRPDFSPTLTVDPENAEAAMHLAYTFVSGGQRYGHVTVVEEGFSTTHVTQLRAVLEEHHVSFKQKSASEVDKNDMVLFPFFPGGQLIGLPVQQLDERVREGKGLVIGIPTSDAYHLIDYAQSLKDTKATGIVGIGRHGSVLRIIGEHIAQGDSGHVLSSVLAAQRKALDVDGRGKTHHLRHGFRAEVTEETETAAQ